MEQNINKVFESPRGRGKIPPYPFRIRSVNRARRQVNIDFIGGSSIALPLHFWMFERALEYLKKRENKFIVLGAKPQPPYIPGSLEEAVWQDPCPLKNSYKISPHICDILSIAGYTEYGKARNPLSGRKIQAVKILDSTIEPIPPLPDTIVSVSKKEKFVRIFKPTIIKWTEEREDAIVEGRLSYSWKDLPTSNCVKKRNLVSKIIILSRIKNSGAVDLETLDEVTRWGFNRDFPLRDSSLVLETTRESFRYLDSGDLKKATETLLKINGVGISRASKIIGLFDQENLCVYDSRVGKALYDLTHNEKKIILTPPGYGREYDYVSNPLVWADYYQKLIWTIEVIRDYLNEKGCTFRSADIEMALFMMGK